MTAAFQACFSDFRIVKGRKVAQLIFEVAIEGADAALETLGGVPRPDKEAWAGIARIDPAKSDLVAQRIERRIPNSDVSGSNPDEITKRRKFSDIPLSQQAALRCNEPSFWRFIEESNGKHDGEPESYANPEAAAQYVRMFCSVKSRADILDNTRAAVKWRRLNSDFESWLKAPESGAA